MSVITKYKIKNICLELENKIKILKSLDDSLTFK